MTAAEQFWNHEIVPINRRFMVDYNPFYYFIEIIRSPLMGKVPELKQYLVVLGVTVVGFALTTLLYRHLRRQLAFYA